MCSFVFWYVSFFGFCFCSFSVSAAFLLLHMLLLFFLTVLCFLNYVFVLSILFVLLCFFYSSALATVLLFVFAYFSGSCFPFCACLAFPCVSPLLCFVTFPAFLCVCCLSLLLTASFVFLLLGWYLCSSNY